MTANPGKILASQQCSANRLRRGHAAFSAVCFTLGKIMASDDTMRIGIVLKHACETSSLDVGGAELKEGC